MSTITPQQYQNDWRRSKKIEDAVAAFLRTVAAETATAPPDGFIIPPKDQLRYDSVAGTGLPAGQPVNLLLNVPAGMATRDLYIRMPRVTDAGQAVTAGLNQGILFFYRRAQEIGRLPIDTGAISRNVQLFGGAPATQALTYSDSFALPSATSYVSNSAYSATPQPTRSNVIVSVRTSAPATEQIVIPCTLRLELDCDQLSLRFLYGTAGTNTGGEILTAYLGCLTSPSR